MAEALTHHELYLASLMERREAHMRKLRGYFEWDLDNCLEAKISRSAIYCIDAEINRIRTEHEQCQRR